MGIYWLASQYEQCLAPAKERVKTWDDDTEFGLALVDRQFDSMFDEAHVFHDRPPNDSYGKDPDKNWYGSLYLRTARDLSLTVPLSGSEEGQRTVTMAQGTMLWFSMGMIRVRTRASQRHRRGRWHRPGWHNYKRPRFEVTQAQPVLQLTDILSTPQLKWSYHASDRALQKDTWSIDLGAWDCVQNYRHANNPTVGDNGHELNSSQPSYKTLKALGVSMWSVVMSHAAHGDGFDGRVGIDAADYYRNNWNITASDGWKPLQDYRHIDEDGFTCDVCRCDYSSADDYWGTRNGQVWCWSCVDENRSSCEWCDADVWNDDDDGSLSYIKMLGTSYEVGICPDCVSELESCWVCGDYNDPRETAPLPEFTFQMRVGGIYTGEGQNIMGQLCPDCANKKNFYKCEVCEEWFNLSDDGCDSDELLCARCVTDRDEEESCDSTECASSV